MPDIKCLSLRLRTRHTRVVFGRQSRSNPLGIKGVDAPKTKPLKTSGIGVEDRETPESSVNDIEFRTSAWLALGGRLLRFSRNEKLRRNS